MARSGLGIAAISEILALTPDAVVERAAALALPRPHDRPMRKPGSRGWAIDDVRRLIALWTGDVATKSIAATIGRSKGSIYYKRRSLGLEARKRSDLRERSVEACSATSLFWLPKAVGEPVAEPNRERAVRLQKRPKRERKWDPERSKRCSNLAFAGLSNAAIAARMSAEYGVQFSAKAVADRLSRLQAFRDRSTPSVDVLPEIEIEARAAAHIARWGMQWRTCEGTGHNFWYSRVIGGPRNTCRAFQRKKYSNKRGERECAAHYSLA